MSTWWHSFALLFALLNPFLLSVYMLPALKGLSAESFRDVLARGALVALFVFVMFAIAGDSIFGDVLHARFASFQIFGGLVFLSIGARYVLEGADVMASTRGPIRTDAGTVAFLYFVGPGTVSASVVVGGRHDVLTATSVIVAAIVVATLAMLIVKTSFDHYHAKRASGLDRSLDVLGRIAGLLVGTYAVEMILNGIGAFVAELP